MVLIWSMLKLRIRPPADAQATWVAATLGNEPDPPATGDGRVSVSASWQVTKALPPLKREPIFSTVAMNP